MGLHSWIWGEPASALLAGALGGTARWLVNQDNWRDGLTAVFVGSVSALYIGPYVEPLIEPLIGKIAPDNDAAGFASFLCGIGGMFIVGMFINFFSIRQAKTKRELDEVQDGEGRSDKDG